MRGKGERKGKEARGRRGEKRMRRGETRMTKEKEEE